VFRGGWHHARLLRYNDLLISSNSNPLGSGRPTTATLAVYHKIGLRPGFMAHGFGQVAAAACRSPDKITLFAQPALIPTITTSLSDTKVKKKPPQTKVNAHGN
jgi:hypothetical protein